MRIKSVGGSDNAVASASAFVVVVVVVELLLDHVIAWLARLATMYYPYL
jgi:hypothetical protein